MKEKKKTQKNLCHEFSDQKKEAIVVLKYGVKIDPTHADLNTNLAKLYTDKKVFAQSVETLETFLAKNRDFKPGYELPK